MKLTAQIALIAAMFLAAGCDTEYYANKMINVNTSRGKMDLAMLGSQDRLIDSGKITAYRSPRIADRTVSLWLINASTDVTTRTGGQGLGTVLLIHDIGRSKASMLSLGGKLAEMGYDVVLPDLCTHGASTGENFTYGANEKRDLKVIMDALLRDGSIASKIIAFGTGLGGSIAVEYAAIDPHCVGVVAYQPFADIGGKLQDDMTYVFLSGADLAEVVSLGCDMAKFDPLEASATEAAARLACPLLVVRRQGDLGYPVGQAHAVYDIAAGAKDFYEIPLGDENWAYSTSRPAYLAGIINSFANGGLVTGYYRAVASGDIVRPAAALADGPGEDGPDQDAGPDQPRASTVIHRSPRP